MCVELGVCVFLYIFSFCLYITINTYMDKLCVCVCVCVCNLSFVVS